LPPPPPPPPSSSAASRSPVPAASRSEPHAAHRRSSAALASVHTPHDQAPDARAGCRAGGSAPGRAASAPTLAADRGARAPAPPPVAERAGALRGRGRGGARDRLPRPSALVKWSCKATASRTAERATGGALPLPLPPAPPPLPLPRRKAPASAACRMRETKSDPTIAYALCHSGRPRQFHHGASQKKKRQEGTGARVGHRKNGPPRDGEGGGNMDRCRSGVRGRLKSGWRQRVQDKRRLYLQPRPDQR
jgi:hypothetical protein